MQYFERKKMISGIDLNRRFRKKKYKPEFPGNGTIVRLALTSLIKTLITSGSDNFIKNFLKSNNLKNTLNLRKNLLLFKVVKFNKKYYSTPTIPAYPSAAYEQMVSRGGLNFKSAGTSLKRQVDSVFLAITNKCNLTCEYCYEKYNINKGKNISPEKWNEVIRTLQENGVSIFILTGGEPLLHFDHLLQILLNADKRVSDFHLHTSGNSITRTKVKKLKEAGLRAAAVGLDDFRIEEHDKMRGKGAFNDAVKALQLFNEEGIMTYVNFCVNRDMLTDDNLYKYYRFVKELKVSMIQLLEPRYCGGYLQKGKEIQLDTDDKNKLLEFTLTGNKKKKYSDYPLIYYVAHIEGKNQLGCHMGGLSHFYIDSAGNVCPCVFFPVQYGNINEENISSIFGRMRSNIPKPLLTDCPSILLADKSIECFSRTKQMPVPFSLIQNEIDHLYAGTKVKEFTKEEMRK